MSMDYKILFRGNVPQEFKDSMGDYISNVRHEDERYIFNDDENKNICFEKVELENITKPPFAYLSPEIFKSEVVKLIMRRAAGNIGGLNIDDLKDDLIEKSFTVKVLNEYSIGHISDIVLNFALERDIHSSKIRPYVLNLLTFLSDLEKSRIVTYPFDLDCGFSKDTFFIQTHCRDNGFVFQNIVDSVKEDKTRGSLFKDFYKHSDLLNIFTIKSSQKLILTSCWLLEDEIRYPSLIIHDVDSLKIDKIEVDNSVSTFIKHSLDNIAKSKDLKSLESKKYFKDSNDSIKINPARILNACRIVEEKVGIPVSTEFDQYSLSTILEDDHDDRKIVSLNQEEEREVFHTISSREAYEKLDEEINKVKSNLEADSYAEFIVKQFNELDADSINRISGSRDKNVEEVQIVKGDDSLAEEDETLIENVTEHFKDNKIEFGAGTSINQNEINNKFRCFSKDQKIQNNEVWEQKKLTIIERMNEVFNEEDTSKEKITTDDVDLSMRDILQDELELDQAEGEAIVSRVRNHATEEILDEEISQANADRSDKLKLEKTESLLNVRIKQVEKMKELISRLKVENFSLRSDVQNLENMKATSSANTKTEKIEADENIEVKLESILNNSDSDKQSTSSLENENKNLKSQIDGLKKRVNFMYQNSETSAGTNLNSTEIEKMAQENLRYKKLINDNSIEIDALKKEKQEFELLSQKTTQSLKNKELSLNKYIDKENEFNSIMSKNKEEIRSLNEAIRELNKENKENALKAKSFEQKLKFTNAQLDGLKTQETKSSDSKGSSSVDPKIKAKIKKLEAMQDKAKQAQKKAEKDLADKKTQLHKVNLENKILNVKVKELERKLGVLGRKAS